MLCTDFINLSIFLFVHISSFLYEMSYMDVSVRFEQVDNIKVDNNDMDKYSLHLFAFP